MARTAKILIALFLFQICLGSTPRENMPECKQAMAFLDDVITCFASWEGQFDHSVSFESESYVQVEQGRLYVQSGGKMRWEYSEPAGKLVVSDGKTVWLYLPDEKRAYKSRIPASKYLPVTARLLFGKMLPSKEFFCVDARTAGGILTLELGFKEKNVNFRRLSISLDLKEKFISKVSYIDELDNLVTFDFSNGKKGRRLEPALFTFTPPAGTKISDDPGDLKGTEF
jgi:outer membrane lipoprotein carrier protein